MKREKRDLMDLLVCLVAAAILFVYTLVTNG